MGLQALTPAGKKTLQLTVLEAAAAALTAATGNRSLVLSAWSGPEGPFQTVTVTFGASFKGARRAQIRSFDIRLFI